MFDPDSDAVEEGCLAAGHQRTVLQLIPILELGLGVQVKKEQGKRW